MSTATPGISALQLQRQLGLGRHGTAWTMLHKLRRAMVAPHRSLLTGEAEVDECEVGGPEADRRGGRSNVAAAVKVVVAVEVRGQGSGRVRMQIIHDASAETLEALWWGTLLLAPSSTRTAGWATPGFPETAMTTGPVPRGPPNAKGNPVPVMPRVHRAIGNFKSWLRGTHRSVGAKHLQVYLDEFTFRYNRRATPMALFQRLLGLESHHEPTTLRQIASQGPSAAKRNMS